MEIIQDDERLTLTRLTTDAEADDGSDVVAGLGAAQKRLPCRYFYDETGSELFERICETPEYYPTRTERAILSGCAAEIADVTGPCELVELGSGSATKTRVLLEAYAEVEDGVAFAPIDVSEEILLESSEALVDQFPGLSVRAYSGTYEDALTNLHEPDAPQRMFIFLGSTLGNFTDDARKAFLARVRRAMAPGDFFLLGIDRQKDPAIIEAAYNDAEGLTARFNRNILSHLNARFDGDFDPEAFTHRAFYDRRLHCVEMHLVSDLAQGARLDHLDLDVDFAVGESIHTEISQKFDPASLGNELAGLGLETTAIWSDPRDWFSLMLLSADGVATQP